MASGMHTHTHTQSHTSVNKMTFCKFCVLLEVDRKAVLKVTKVRKNLNQDGSWIHRSQVDQETQDVQQTRYVHAYTVIYWFGKVVSTNPIYAKSLSFVLSLYNSKSLVPVHLSLVEDSPFSPAPQSPVSTSPAPTSSDSSTTHRRSYIHAAVQKFE